MAAAGGQCEPSQLAQDHNGSGQREMGFWNERKRKSKA
jgi:hypothetical protein